MIILVCPPLHLQDLLRLPSRKLCNLPFSHRGEEDVVAFRIVVYSTAVCGWRQCKGQRAIILRDVATVGHVWEEPVVDL